MIKNPMHRLKKRPILSAVLLVLAFYLLWILIELAPFANFFFHPFRLLGGHKNYLIVFQNNYELRPTGGFISAFGILTLKNGVPAAFKFEDVYRTVDEHPRVEPPEPLGKLLEHPSYRGHSFRDANFYPNFPDSAAEMEKYLHLTRPFQQVDGVFAVNMSFLEDWIEAVGLVEVNGKIFTKNNLLEEMESSVSDVDLHDLDELANRKMIIKNLAKKMALKTLLPWNLPRFLETVSDSLDRKNLIVFFKDEVLEKRASKNGWSGRLVSDSGQDFLAVVDANYGGGKSNRYVSRNIFYYVDLVSGSSSLDVRIDQPGEHNIPFSTDYKGYLRAYVPLDHKLINAEIVDDAAFSSYEGAEAGFSFAGLSYRVPVKESRTAHFDFQFPKSIFDTLTYRLNLWKQPGTTEDFYQVTVRLPNGYHLESDDFEVRENIAVFRGFLKQDKALIFDLKPDKETPRAIEQTLEQLNVFEMEWNEPVAADSIKTGNWTVKDINFENSNEDSVRVKNVRVEGTRIFIETEGMTNQPEERYKLGIEGLSDYAGNKLQRRTYTFFQRIPVGGAEGT